MPAYESKASRPSLSTGANEFYEIFITNIERMTSVQTKYAQRDTRLETITLTGNISNNGSKSGAISDQNPAYAGIDLTKSRNFVIDTSILTIRTDGTGIFLLRIYLSSTKPPSYYQNFEFDIFFTPPGNEQPIFIEIYGSKAAAENAQIIATGPLYGISNEYPGNLNEYSDVSGIITFKVLNNSIILKSIPPSYSN